MTRPLYCDESIWIPVADGLRRRGWTVHTARDEGTLGDPDQEQLQYAVENDWIPHERLIYVRQSGRQIGDVVKIVDEHLQNRAEDDRSIQYL